MGARPLIAIEVGRRELRAVHAVARKDGIELRRTVCVPRPDDLDFDDGGDGAAWVGAVLTEAGIPHGRATVVLAREHVALKRLVLPTAEAAELPEMTRLAMQRDLPFDPADAVMDYVPIERGPGSTTVLAVAAPRGACAGARAVVEAAGWKVGAIALRTMGTLALLREGANGAGVNCHLIIDVTPGGVEFSVVEGNAIQFSRAAEMPTDLTEPQAIADAIRTETRRTWMSYRVGEDSREVDETVVVGDRTALGQAAETVGEMLKTPARVLDGHPAVDVGDAPPDRVWPLIGLLLESSLGTTSIDFANPRRPADPRHALRRRGMMAAGLVVVLGMLALAFGQRDLANREDLHEELRTTYAQLFEADCRYFRERFRAEHLERWQALDVRWLDHLEHLQTVLPAVDSVVLDSWTGALGDPDVRYDQKAEGDRWRVSPQLLIVIEGEAHDRATADAVRDRFVEMPWLRAESSGSDTAGGKRHPFGFTYRLRTSRLAPVVVDGGEGGAGEGGTGEDGA